MPINFNFERPEQAVLDREAGKTSSFRSLVKEDTCIFWKKADPGSYHIRILPPREGPSSHWGEDAHIHYQVGGGKKSYLCLERMGQARACPVCEFNQKHGVKQWWPSRAVLVRLIDRNDPDSKIKAWLSPRKMFDETVSVMCRALTTGATMVSIDDPVEGRDIKFIRQGTGVTDTKYIIASICDPSPLGDDDLANSLLDVVREHPLETLFNYVDAETIKEELALEDETVEPVAPVNGSGQQETQQEAEAAFEQGEASSTDSAEPVF